MNFRKDIFDRMTYMVKTETNKKPNYAKLARQFNCDYRTVKLLQISDDQMKHITNVDSGHGLVKVGSDLVPFERKFSKDTKLYKMMTTKVSELG